MRLLVAILSMITNLFVTRISGAAYINAIISCFPVGQGGGTVLVLLFSLRGRGVLSFGNNRTTGFVRVLSRQWYIALDQSF